MIVAIDGPAGAGKSSIARALARRLGLPVLDTGAIYRALAWWALEREIALDDAEAVEELLGDFPLRMKADAHHPRGARVFVGPRDVTQAIRSPEISRGASIVSAHPGVRKRLLGLQRALASEGCVAEGRDMGSVVFPDAKLKFFLTASARARAERRLAELEAVRRADDSMAGLTTLEEVEREIVQRDERDASRATAPLRQAEDALRIDTSDLSEGEVLELLLQKIAGRVGARSGPSSDSSGSS